ncbi:MAG: TIGR02391 family protein [Bryobacteraceae bacterium]
MARRVGAQETIPPTLTPQRAIELVRKQLGQFDVVFGLQWKDPDVEKWVDTTAAILDGALGRPSGGHHDMTSKFKYVGGVSFSSQSDQFYQREHQDHMRRRKAVLESCIQQLEMLAPPAAQVAPDRYQFHAEIERVSGQLFRDGHYKNAALEAYIRVIDEVKRRSGLALDGDSLMNQAFGCENRTPVIQLSALGSDAERDEQKGFMFLFKGIVGLRNSKAHSNRLFNDPYRAHDYLALASLLMRILEL